MKIYTGQEMLDMSREDLIEALDDAQKVCQRQVVYGGQLMMALTELNKQAEVILESKVQSAGLTRAVALAQVLLEKKE